MAMSDSDIQPGWVYRTSNQQERLVLGHDRDGRVVYVSKGRNAAAPFHNCHVRVTTRRFAERAIGKVRFVDELWPFIVANKATTVVVGARPPRRPAAAAGSPEQATVAARPEQAPGDGSGA